MKSERNCQAKGNEHLLIVETHSLSSHIGSVSVKKACPGEKSKGMAGQPFAEGISGMTHGGPTIQEWRGVTQERSVELLRV